MSRRREGGVGVEGVVRAERAGRFFFVVVLDEMEDVDTDFESEGEPTNVWDRERVSLVVEGGTALDIAERERVARPSLPLETSSSSSFRFSDSDSAEEDALSSPKLLISAVVWMPSFLVTRWKYLFSRPLKDSVLLTGTSSLSSMTG